jgi:hypothetical protein
MGQLRPFRVEAQKNASSSQAILRRGHSNARNANELSPALLIGQLINTFYP